MVTLLTAREKDIITSYREALASGTDFTLVIQHEILDTGGGMSRILTSRPVRTVGINTHLYELCNRVKGQVRPALYLINLDPHLITFQEITSPDPEHQVSARQVRDQNLSARDRP